MLRSALTPGPSPISHPPPAGRGENFGKRHLTGEFFFFFSPLSRGQGGGSWERGRG
jgi:hypothetical protein